MYTRISSPTALHAQCLPAFLLYLTYDTLQHSLYCGNLLTLPTLQLKAPTMYLPVDTVSTSMHSRSSTSRLLIKMMRNNEMGTHACECDDPPVIGAIVCNYSFIIVDAPRASLSNLG